MQSNGAPMSYGAQLRAAMQAMRTNDEQFLQFTRGLGAVLQQWTALQLVSLHCDARAPAVLYDDLCAWHQRDGEVYADDLEVYFEEFFDNVREVKIEDDSMKEVGTVLHDMYCRCCVNDFSMVEHFLGTLQIYQQTNPVAMSVNGGTAEELAEDDAEDGGDNEAASEEDGEECDMDNEEEQSSAAAAAPQPLFQQAPELPQPPPPQQQQQKQPKQQKKRKNASVRDKNGWNIVQ